MNEQIAENDDDFYLWTVVDDAYDDNDLGMYRSNLNKIS